ncbi:glycosyl transferase [Paramecium bursaria Chlorella virus NE-JV-1]|nr:glycosyl transferase [Paramecium bursaria Chlorella virus NE-JV-1]
MAVITDYDEMYRYSVSSFPEGQLGASTPVGKFLTEIVQNPEIKTIIEVGTWNGRGSTKCIVDGLLKRGDKTKFYSLEADEGRCKSGQDFWSDRDKGNVDLHLLWGKLSEGMVTREYVQTHPKFSDQLQYYDIEAGQTHHAPLIDNELPDEIDMIFLDGGEFCSVFDFNYLMKKYGRSIKVIGLDDIDTIKNQKIYENLTQTDSPWKVLASGPHPGRVGNENGHTWAFFVKNIV